MEHGWVDWDERNGAHNARIGYPARGADPNLPSAEIQMVRFRALRSAQRPGFGHSARMRTQRLDCVRPRCPIRPAWGLNDEILLSTSILLFDLYWALKVSAAGHNDGRSNLTRPFPDPLARAMLPHSEKTWNALQRMVGAVARIGSPPRRFSSRSSSRQASSRT